MKKLDIYRVIEGTDDWALVTTIEDETDEAVIAMAERDYSSEEYHWTNPY